MKPTPQIASPTKSSVHRSFPLTDFGYHTTVQTPPRTSSSSQKARVLTSSSSSQRSIWKMSNDYFRAESSRAFLGEVCAPVVVGALAASPIVFALYRMSLAMWGY